jgi:probable HAF family extracellular repeat protein
MTRDSRLRCGALLSAALLSLMATVCWSQQPSLTWLGGLPRYSQSIAYGVSADGRVVVSVAFIVVGLGCAFRWENGVIQDLGTLGGKYSFAYGVSADGRVVVGWASDSAERTRAFRWENGVMQDLGTLGGSRSEAYGVSADGRVVVGGAEDAFIRTHAFRWENGVMQGLSSPRGGISIAHSVSADGTVIVGLDYDRNLQARAFRWEGGTMQNLGTLGSDYSFARGVSADGHIVVGGTEDAAGRNRRALRWTAERGIEDLNLTYAQLLTPGSRLATAYAVSPDGRYIVGTGYNAATNRWEAFLLDTGFPLRGDVDRNGCVDDADLLRVLFAFGGQGYRNEDLNWDGAIDDADLLIVLLNFGSGC